MNTICKNNNHYLFTSESVSEGHPDKLCDQISDAILDRCLELDPNAHVACESFATTNFLLVGGEIGFQDPNPQLPEMSLSEFQEAVSALKEVVSAFDFDSADMIIGELSNYSIPAAYAPKFTEIKKAIKSVDQQAVVKLLDEIN